MLSLAFVLQAAVAVIAVNVDYTFNLTNAVVSREFTPIYLMRGYLTSC